jgi:hypothetical protein
MVESAFKGKADDIIFRSKHLKISSHLSKVNEDAAELEFSGTQVF